MTAAAASFPIVNGATRLFGILGDPIEQVKSPEEITKRFRARGANALCLPIHARPDDFDAVLRGIKATGNYDGFILTVPHKIRAMSYVDTLLPRAVRVGAVNVVRRERNGTWIGDMYDGLGLVGAIRQTGFDPKGKRAMVLGAGGAGSAIADAIAEAGAAAVMVFDLERAKAEALANRLAKAHNNCQITAGPATAEHQDLVVNATPTGMAPGDGMPAKFGLFDSNLVVADVVTKPDVTPLIAHARRCGCRTSTGAQMFNAQGDMIASFLVPEVPHG